MSIIDWYWTGRNNAWDGNYWPPFGIGMLRIAAYKFGYIHGKFTR